MTDPLSWADWEAVEPTARLLPPQPFDYVCVISSKAPDLGSDEQDEFLTDSTSTDCFPPPCKEDEAVISQLPLFVFPRGLATVASERIEGAHHGFVLTDIHGRRRYGACVISLCSQSGSSEDSDEFEDQLNTAASHTNPPPTSTSTTSATATQGEDESARRELTRMRSQSVLQSFDGPAAFVIISRWPLHSTMFEALRQLYLSCATNTGSVEALAFSLIYKTPLPPRCGMAVALPVVHHDEVPPAISMPSFDSLPFCDISVAPLFECLGVGNVVSLLTALLTERSVLVHSSYTSLLCSVTEAALCLLQPFVWPFVYIPVLPAALLDIIDAPTQYFLGVPTNTVRDRLPSLVDDAEVDMVVFDLDRDTVTDISPPAASSSNTLRRSTSVLLAAETASRLVARRGLAATLSSAALMAELSDSGDEGDDVAADYEVLGGGRARSNSALASTAPLRSVSNGKSVSWRVNSADGGSASKSCAGVAGLKAAAARASNSPNGSSLKAGTPNKTPTKTPSKPSSNDSDEMGSPSPESRLPETLRQQASRQLPPRLRARLCLSLNHCKSPSPLAHSTIMCSPHSSTSGGNGGSAGGIGIGSGGGGGERSSVIDEHAVRETIFSFLCSLIAGYRGFLDRDSGGFDSAGFLDAQSEDSYAFMGTFVQSSLFQAFMRDRGRWIQCHDDSVDMRCDRLECDELEARRTYTEVHNPDIVFYVGQRPPRPSMVFTVTLPHASEGDEVSNTQGKATHGRAMFPRAFNWDLFVAGYDNPATAYSELISEISALLDDEDALEDVRLLSSEGAAVETATIHAALRHLLLTVTCRTSLGNLLRGLQEIREIYDNHPAMRDPRLLYDFVQCLSETAQAVGETSLLDSSVDEGDGEDSLENSMRRSVSVVDVAEDWTACNLRGNSKDPESMVLNERLPPGDGNTTPPPSPSTPGEVDKKMFGMAACMHSAKLVEMLLSLFKALSRPDDDKESGALLVDDPELLGMILVSPKYCEFVRETAALKHADVFSFSSKQKLCFWVNVRNALAMHACLEVGAPVNFGMRAEWVKASYNIGGYIFSLADIEFAVLRAASAKPAFFYLSTLSTSTFDNNDPRLGASFATTVEFLDFVLTHASASSPIIPVLTPKRIDEQIFDAVSTYINHHVHVDKRLCRVVLPKFFEWYGGDYGGSSSAVLKWICDAVPQSEVAQFVATNVRPRVSFGSYSWDFALRFKNQLYQPDGTVAEPTASTSLRWRIGLLQNSASPRNSLAA